jgi:phage portal protein BeeE
LKLILPGGRTLRFFEQSEERFNLGQYPQFLQDYYSQFGYAGSLYPLGLNQTAMSWSKTEEIAATLPNYMIALRRSPPAFAAQSVRAGTLSQARFVWRNRADKHIFRDKSLGILERPWPNGTTGELLARMEWSEGLSGQAYVYRQSVDRLRVLRPDWVKIVYGSQSEPDDPKWALDGEVVGYAYLNGGWTQNNKNQMTVILPEQMCHWTPLPDPMSPGLGMSWITPALRELQADQAAEEYKLAFFSNGATPNLVVKAGDPKYTAAQFQEWVDKMETTHKGAVNAFKTLYLTSGADATVIGSNLQQLDLTSITSHSETRISYLSRVPAVILGIAAGLKGSSLNAGNYGEARRNFADSWYYTTLQDACAALGQIVPQPGGAQLWYDVADVPLLREDAKDAADIEQVKATTINSYVTAGFTPESAIQAVGAQDINLLVHSGLVSVQLIPPGTTASPDTPQTSPDGAAETPSAA